jgi:CRISPR-associated protein Cas5t
MMLCLHVKAPFAAFRTFTAGSYRPTAPFITPSSAYGLILNVAGIESRYDDGHAPMTLMKLGLPKAEIALGAIVFPEIQSVYQQLHNYPVGSTGKERAKESKGTKYNIQPIRREFLSGLDAYICLRGNSELEEQARVGLQEGAQWTPKDHLRYGIPFLGDNNFMVDILREEPFPGPAYWYKQMTSDEAASVDRRCRLTVWIDRADMSRTRAFVYAPLQDATSAIPERAWTLIEPPSDSPTIKKRRKGK